MQGSLRGRQTERATLTLGQWDEDGSETLLAPLALGRDMELGLWAE